MVPSTRRVKISWKSKMELTLVHNEPFLSIWVKGKEHVSDLADKEYKC
jgi:hypothetical protein